MADITVRIEKSGGSISIAGEATQAGHEGEIEAIAIRDLIEAPTGTAKAQLSEIFLTRYRDKASPKLAEACSMGENLGTVTVSLFKNTETGPQVFMKYTLTTVRIAENRDPEDTDAFLPHRAYIAICGPRVSRAVISRMTQKPTGLSRRGPVRYPRPSARPRRGLGQWPMTIMTYSVRPAWRADRERLAADQRRL